MDLILIRHGIAEDTASSDSARPLTKEGREITEAVAKGLQSFLPHPDLVVDSSLRRADQTAEIFAQVCGGTRAQWSPLVPGGDSEDLLRHLQSHTDKDVIFLVGHEPDMGRHASYLLSGQAKSFCQFKKAGVMWIEFVGPLVSGGGNLKCYLPPALSKRVRPKK